ncbi:MAG: ATP-binding protein [Niastella sp.]|nr:ATP-binding protein [Niastella sp.]
MPKWLLIIYCIGVAVLHATAQQPAAQKIPPKRDSLIAQAERFRKLGDSLPESDTSATGKVATLQKALALYDTLQIDTAWEALLDQIAVLHIRQDKWQLAEQEVQQLLHYQQSNGSKDISITYDLLTTIYRSKGALSQAFYYAVQAIEKAEAVNDTAMFARVYGRLGAVYKDLNQYDKALVWHRKALEWQYKSRQKNAFVVYNMTWSIVHDLLPLARAKEALDLVLEVTTKYPAERSAEKVVRASMLGECYNELKQYKLAEKYFIESVTLEEKNPHGYSMHFNIYYNVGKFYNDQRQYEQSRYYLLQAAATKGFINHANQRNVQLLLFRVDSAAGKYIAAIEHYQKYKSISDTLYDITRNWQMEEMQAKFETDKKEQDIQILRKESLLQQTELKQASLSRNITIAVIILLLIIIALLYNRYRIRQQSNIQLESQQIEINHKNTSLQKLLDEKENLLTEKEWLIKEIHHRVNNNLQIVMSLLNSQSAYLDSDSAIMAIRDSQHRMRAMSLIHQKLYQSDKMATIDMQVYIQELTSYLDDNFNVNNRIKFELDIPPIELDVAQAVPLGLILNEAITNAIKYAFPDNKQGNVIISMQRQTDEYIKLTITDNGQGLPPAFDVAGSHSLGMSLIQGLTKQLNGDFEMKSDEGVTITVTF